MKIDLNDKLVRTLVQEYLNAILNYHNKEELDYDLHKIIHTFQVVSVAQDLIKLTRPALSSKIKEQIINAAFLHDIGRCHEFINGHRRVKFDHGRYGCSFIQTHFPKLKIEAECTKWHNRMPSEKDPSDLFPVLDYVRDADILGNIWYNAKNMPIFIEHILEDWQYESHCLVLNNEIRQSALEKRSCVYSKMEKFDSLDMLVAQLLWIYNLRTKAAFRFAKQTGAFSKYRDAIIEQALPMLKAPATQKEKVAKDIRKLFPDSLFDEELKRYGI